MSREKHLAITAAYKRGEPVRSIEARFGISEGCAWRIAKRYGAKSRRSDACRLSNSYAQQRRREARMVAHVEKQAAHVSL